VNANSTLSLGTGSWSSGTLVVDSKTRFDGTLDISAGTKYISGALNNYGVVNQFDYYYGYYFIYLNNSSQIVNKADATYNLTAGNISRNVPSDYQGAKAKFVNQGTFNKINTSFVGVIYIDFDNTGLVNIEGGSLYLNDELLNNGTVTINAGGLYNTGKLTNNNVISLNAGAATFSGGGDNRGRIYVDIDAALNLGGVFNFGTGSQITGRGSVTLNAGQINFNPNQTTFSSDLTFNFNGGSLNYTGNLSLRKYALSSSVGQLLVNANSTLSLGTGSWSSGTLVVDSKTRFDGTLDISAGTKYISGVLNNYGVVNQFDYSYYYGYTNLYLNNSSQIINEADAIYKMSAGRIAQYSTNGSSATAQFNNEGILIKNQSEYNSYIDVLLNNSGVLEVSAGNLYIRNEFYNTGTVNVRGGIADFSGDFYQSNGSIVLHNGRLNSSRTLNIQNGQIGGYGTIAGNVNNSGLINPFVDGPLGSQISTLNISGNYSESNSARIDIQIKGRSAGTGFDVINITGAASFDGTINVSFLDNFMPILGDRFRVINYGSFTGSDNLDFSDLILGNGLRLNPIFDSKHLTFVVASSVGPDASNDAYGANKNQRLIVNDIQGVLANDIHPNNDSLNTLLVTGPSNGNVSLNSTGSFTYDPNPGFIGTDTFTYKAVDRDGDFDVATVSISVTAPPVDLAPTVANPISGIYVLLNSDDTIINLSNVFTDPDDDISLISKTIIANSNRSLVNASINMNLLTLSYLPGQTGQANITIQALSDGQTVNESFTVLVQPDVDRAPVVAHHIPAQVVQMNAANSVIDISSVFTDPDNDNSLITKSILSVSNMALFDDVRLIGNQLTLDYSANKYGRSEVLVKAESNGKTVIDSFTVYVQAPDTDNPPFVLNPLPDLKRRVNPATEYIDLRYVFGDVDNNPELIMKALFGNTNPDLVNASINGNQLRLDYNDNLEGTSELTIWGFSNGKLAQDTFAVKISNRLPVIVNPIADQNINEGSYFVLNIGSVFNDPEGENLTYSFAKPNWLSYDSSTKSLRGTPGNSNIGTSIITVSATDNDGQSDEAYGSISDSFNLTVLDQPNGTLVIEDSAYFVNEAAEFIRISVQRLDSSLGQASVRVATQAVTASSPSDYIHFAADLAFVDGETSKSFDIVINNDILPEGGINQTPETFRVFLSNAFGGAQLGTQSSALVNIVDDEPAVTPPVAADDNKEANALETITIHVLNNDSDPDGYRLPIEIHRIKTNGFEYDPYTSPVITTELGGVISIFNNKTPENRADDQLYYTAPSVNVFGVTDTFAYTISDGDLGTDFVSNYASVNVSITPETRSKSDGFDISINGNMVSYQDDGIESFANQDFNGRFTLYDRNTIDLDGNTWKAVALKDYGYTGGYVISTNTTLSFEYRSNVIGEIQGIAWSRENLTTTNIYPPNVINVYGFNSLYGIRNYEYTSAGSWQTFSINLGEHDNSVVNYLVFVGDDDANNKADSQFRNIAINQSTRNRRPTDIGLSSNIIGSMRPISTLVGILSATDPDNNDSHTYSLVDGQGDDDNNLFRIVNNQLRTRSILERHAKTSYSIRVRADDQDGSGLAKSFNIGIVDLSASVGSQSAQLVEANASLGISSATIAITKANVDGTASFDTSHLVSNGWNLSSGNVYIKAGTYGSASFDVNSGIISYSLDNNAAATEALTEGQPATDAFGSIRVIDSYDTALSNGISFAITGSNDAPTISVGSQSAQLLEAAGINNGIAGTPSASIALSLADVDDIATYDITDLIEHGWSLSSGNVYIKAGTYGSASFDISSGIISYSLENNATATQALTEGQAATDAFGSIRAISGYDIARSDLIAFAITGGNDAPTVTSPTFVYFADNSTDTAYIMTGTDPESSNLSYAISGGTDAALFAINSRTGAISFITAPDYEAPSDANADNTYVINVVAIDGALSGADKTVRILVTNENEAPTAVTLANTIPSLPENTVRSSSIKVADIIISDDLLGINTISLSGADAAAFKVVESALFLKADTTFDFESQNSYSVTVSVSDATIDGSSPVSTSYNLAISDLNEAPTAVTLTNTIAFLPENTSKSSALKVADIIINDDAIGINTITLSGADTTAFEVIGTALFLKADTTLDFETKNYYSLTLSVLDASIINSSPIATTYDLAIRNLNEAPTAVTLANTVVSLPENTSTSNSSIKVADIVITDDDLGTNTISLSGADASTFELVDSAIYLKTDIAFDFETKNSYNLIVSVLDATINDFTPITASYNLAISDLNEAPTAVTLANTIVILPENTSTSSAIKVADIVISDDALGHNTTSLSGADATDFEVLGTAIYIKAGTALDFESQNSYRLTVSVLDTSIDGSSPVTTSYSLALSDQNDAPTAPTATVAITAISSDTGSSASDFITADTSLVISGTNSSLNTDEKVQISTDGSTWADVAPASTTSWTYTDSTTRSSNVTYQLRVIDSAGNVGLNTASQLVTVDTAAPTLTITDSEAGTLNITDGAVTFTFTLSEAVTGFDTSKVTVDNGSKGLFSGSGTTYTLVVTPTASLAGNITVDVSTTGVTDVAGNQATPPAQYTQVFDTSAPNAPVLTLGTGVANGATSAEANATGGVVTLTAESGSSVAVTFTCGSNTVTKTVTGNSTTAVPVVLAPADLTTLGNGTVSVSATASDSAGNASSAGTTSFLLDTVAPLFVSGPNPIGVSNITFTTNENGQAALYKTDSTPLFPTGVSVNTATTLTLVAQASITTATLNITDGAGNLTAAAPTFLLGTSSADQINGTNAADFLYGFAGNDSLVGSSGNDTLNGGDGIDTLIGGLGNDTYIVDSTTDTIAEDLGAGIDTVQSSLTYALGANLDNLTLTGTTAINGTGNSLNNVITGNEANNILNGGAGIDTLIGGLGNDTYIVDSTTDTIAEDLGAGIDTVQSSLTYALGTNLDNLTLTGATAINGTGNSLNNSLIGNTGNNILTAFDGNDYLDGGSGNDTLIGGTGNDTYVLDNPADLIIENPSEGTDSVRAAFTYTLAADLENLTLTGTTAINGTGNSLNNSLIGNTGNNILTAFDGNDYLDGGSGNDTLIGGTGNDTYVLDNPADVIIENPSEGTDSVRAAFTYTLAADLENLTLTGTTAINGTGNSLNNSLIGNTADNILTGGDGNDYLDGGSGNDTLIGGTGNDTYVLDNLADVIIENPSEGTDSVRAAFTYTLAADLENLTLTGTTAINGTGNSLNNSLIGNTADNILTGGDGNDYLDGGSGNDTLIGGTGNDTYVLDNLADVIIENPSEGTDSVRVAFNYTLAADLENLTLTGTTAINGTGNSLNNSLIGNTADNTLTGGTGLDIVTGGAGSDTFSYAAGDALISGTTSLSFERITDFTIGTDSLDCANTVSASNLRKLGSVGTSLSSTTIVSLLTPTNFTANGASAFTFGAGSGLRTFLALNDANAGFQTSTDNIIEITGYTGVLNNLAII